MTSLTKLKNSLLDGPTIPVGIVSHQHISAHGSVRISLGSTAKLHFLIDLLLEHSVKEIVLHLTNLDLKLDQSEVIGFLYREDGIGQFQKYTLQYDYITHNFIVDTQLSQMIPEGRILLLFTLVQEGYTDHPVHLRPISGDGPDMGGPCR
jgi:hypothetical protein